MAKKSIRHIPYPVLGLVVENDWNLLTAWCRYLGLSWKEISVRADISLLELAAYEHGPNQRCEELEKIAIAIGVELEQLIDQ